MLTRTYERCYICDRNHVTNKNVDSVYASGLSYKTSGDSVRVKNGKPICRVCRSIAMIALNDMNLEELDFSYTGWIFNRSSIPKELNNSNIDWEEVIKRRVKSGVYRFPLPLKTQPTPVGWKYHSPVTEHPLTGEEKEAINLLQKGFPQTKKPKTDEAGVGKARAVLERQINAWRWEDLAREKTSVRLSDEDLDPSHDLADYGLQND